MNKAKFSSKTVYGGICNISGVKQKKLFWVNWSIILRFPLLTQNGEFLSISIENNTGTSKDITANVVNLMVQRVFDGI